MMRKPTIAFALMIIATCSYAQGNYSGSPFGADLSSKNHTSEFGISAGVTAFLGDLGGTRGKGEPFVKDLNSFALRPHVGISYGYYPVSWLKVMGAFNFTTIAGADSLIKERYKQSLGRAMRNLSFRSRVEELSLNLELYPLQMISGSQRETALQPFVGAGIGGFHFNPQADLNGAWIDLQPLRLEGQGFSEYPTSQAYSLYQFYVPVNLGFKYRVSDQVSIGFMATFRKTFSDNLDDVSHQLYVDPNLFDKYLTADQAILAKQLYFRGDPSKPIRKDQLRSDGVTNDSFTSLAVTFSYKLGSRNSDGRNEGYIRVKRHANGAYY